MIYYILINVILGFVKSYHIQIQCMVISMKKILIFSLNIILFLCFFDVFAHAIKAFNKSVEEEKVVYLTFDDGPSILTDKVLDILKDNDVRATFFLIGNQVNDRTLNMLIRMDKEGHQIGVHTYSHDASTIYADADAYYRDILKAEQTIINRTGIVPVVYRFPYGSNNSYIMKYRKRIIRKLKNAGLNYCDWNVSGEDSIGNPSVSKIISNVKSNYSRYNEPVVLLHDSASNKETISALPQIIKMYKDAGYKFGTISERSRIYQWRVQ